MFQLEDKNVSRRAALATTALFGATSLFPGSRPAQADERHRKEASYCPPEWESKKGFDYLNAMPVSKATRYASGVPATCGTKTFVDARGSILISTLQFLDRSGWMSQRRESSRVRMPAIENADGTEPDIVPSQSSGVLMTIGSGSKTRDIYLSNEHALRAARWQLEEKSIFNWHYDLGVIPAEHLLRYTDDRFELAKGRLADESITNANLSSRSVEVVGFGSDLFKFIGTPFKLPYHFSDAAGLNPNQMQQHLLFGMRIPEGFLRDISEIGGMSGSPVVLQGTREVVGIVCRVAQTLDGDRAIPHLVFVGPNEVRRIIDRATEGSLK
jgi:hypothetical protein